MKLEALGVMDPEHDTRGFTLGRLAARTELPLWQGTAGTKEFQFICSAAAAGKYVMYTFGAQC